jgi:hypothetical protein
MPVSLRLAKRSNIMRWRASALSGTARPAGGRSTPQRNLARRNERGKLLTQIAKCTPTRQAPIKIRPSGESRPFRPASLGGKSARNGWRWRAVRAAGRAEEMRTAMLFAMPSTNRGRRRQSRDGVNIRSPRYSRAPARCRSRMCRVGHPLDRYPGRQCESSRLGRAGGFVSVACR